MFRKFSIITIIGFSLILFAFCKKKKNVVQDNVPYQTVNITIYPNDPLYFKIQAIGGWMYINGGVNGIIVYRKTQNDFVAIERTSTYLPDNPNAAVKVQSDNFTLKDTISNAKWQITDGAVLAAPATVSLRLYTALYDNGTGALSIRN